MRDCEVCKREVRDCEGMIETFIGMICVECDCRVREMAGLYDRNVMEAAR